MDISYQYLSFFLDDDEVRFSFTYLFTEIWCLVPAYDADFTSYPHPGVTNPILIFRSWRGLVLNTAQALSYQVNQNQLARYNFLALEISMETC